MAKRQKTPLKTPPLLPGHASVEGTKRFAARFVRGYSADFYRPLGCDGPRVSSIGLGTYLGECDEEDDVRYTATVRRALDSGVNLFDAAINYRCQRSERAIGRALAAAMRSGAVERDEVIVCTKGGYIPFDGVPPASREAYQAYLKRHYLDPGIVRPTDIVAGGHCLAPSYLADQLQRSRLNLGLATLDVYYLHNPEQQLDVITPADLRERLALAFALLEDRCAAGEIAGYGCATWNGFRVPPEVRGHLSLADLVQLAREVAGEDHHFRVVQLPINLALTEAVRTPTQRLANGQLVSLLQAAAELGIAVVASAPLLQAKLTSGLPRELRAAIPGYSTDAQRAIAFVRSLPIVTAALVGMRRPSHVEENLDAAKQRELALK